MKLSLCIPMYNEESVLPATLQTVSSYMAEHFGPDDYEILFSNDGSTDRSPDLVKNFPDPHIRLVGYEKNHGKGCAVRTAMLESRGDISIFTDCDLAYDLDVVVTMCELFDRHPEADVIIGSRAIAKDGYEGYPLLRKIASKVYFKMLSVISSLKTSDSQTGLKGFRRKAADLIFSRCETDGFAFDFEALLFAQKFNLCIEEMPVRVIHQGESKVHVLRDATRMIRDVRKIKRRVKAAPMPDDTPADV